MCQWISVKDRLPDQTEPYNDKVTVDVLIYTENEEILVGWYSLARSNWYDPHDIDIIHGVTHWAYITKPGE